MIRIQQFTLVTLLMISSLTSSAFEVYESETPTPYIQLQPNQGVYLGQMMRNIGLKPDWSNRMWIRLIHEANPGQVDAAGEILYHDQLLKVPLSALKSLQGYNSIADQMYPVNPQPMAQPQPEPPPEEANATEEVKEESPARAGTEDPTGSRFDILFGAGSEKFNVDDGLTNRTELLTESDFFLKLDFYYRPSLNHQWGISGQSQIKTYQAPSNILYNSDQEHILEFRYNYGYRIFNSVFLNFVGQSKQFNQVNFVNAALILNTYFAHSLGLGFEFIIVDVAHKVVSLSIDGHFIYADSAPTDTDNGLYSSLELKIEPTSVDSGFIIGVRANHYEQKPKNYSKHTSFEGLGFIGYAF